MIPHGIDGRPTSRQKLMAQAVTIWFMIRELCGGEWRQVQAARGLVILPAHGTRVAPPLCREAFDFVFHRKDTRNADMTRIAGNRNR